MGVSSSKKLKDKSDLDPPRVDRLEGLARALVRKFESDNKISEESDSTSTRGYTVDLNRLALKAVPTEIFASGGCRITCLILKGNRLQKVPSAFTRLSDTLEVLDLSMNHLRDTPLRELSLKERSLYKDLRDKRFELRMANEEDGDDETNPELLCKEIRKIERRLGLAPGTDLIAPWHGGTPSEPVLGSLTHLIRLDLSRNAIISLPSEEIGQLTALIHLDLHSNHIGGYLPAELGNCSSLEYLDVSGNSLLRGIPSNFNQLGSLQVLNLSGGHIEELPDDVGLGLSSLTYLNVNDCPIKQMPPSLATGCQSLIRLEWRMTHVKSFTEEMSRLTNLTYLDISPNHCESFPETPICTMTNLQSLHVSGVSDITEIPKSFSQLQNLTHLSLRWNKLTEFPSVLEFITGLVDLDLAGNDMVNLPGDVLNSLSNLQVLNMSFNKLTTDGIPRELCGHPQLRRVDFSDNTTLDLVALNDLDSELCSCIRRLQNRFPPTMLTVQQWIQQEESDGGLLHPSTRSISLSGALRWIYPIVYHTHPIQSNESNGDEVAGVIGGKEEDGLFGDYAGEEEEEKDKVEKEEEEKEEDEKEVEENQFHSDAETDSKGKTPIEKDDEDPTMRALEPSVHDDKDISRSIREKSAKFPCVSHPFNDWKLPDRTNNPLSTPELVDKIYGIIFGNAVGDAVGLATEFLNRPRASFSYGISVPNYRSFLRDRHRSRWEPGDWTDDTDQMLLILFNLMEHDGMGDMGTYACDLLRWAKQGMSEHGDEGGLGIGATVGAVLQHEKFLGDSPFLAAEEVWLQRDKRAAANGAVMRTSVTGIPQFDSLDAVIARTSAYARVTHRDGRCVASAVAVALLIAQMLQGCPTRTTEDIRAIADVAISNASQFIEREEYLSAFEKHCNAADFKELDLSESSAIGYTLKCVGCAFVALGEEDFERCLSLLTLEAGDADTNGAVAGAVLGCKLGFRGIPYEWIEALPHKEWLSHQARIVCQLALGEM